MKQSRVADVFGVPLITVKRYAKLYRENGPAGFYAEPKRRGPAVLTPEVLEKIRQMLDQGAGIPEIASERGLRSNTLAKALRAGRLHQPLKKPKQ